MSVQKHRLNNKEHTLQGFDNQGGGRGDNGHGSLTILDCELHGHAKTFPLRSSLRDVFTDFFGGLQCGENMAYKKDNDIPDQEDRSWGRVQTKHQLHHLLPLGR